MGKRSTSERGVINRQKRLKSLGKAVCCLKGKQRVRGSMVEKWIRKLRQKRQEGNLWWSTSLSLQHRVWLQQKWSRWDLKLQNSFPIRKSQAPESCFCYRGSGAKQEMQDEGISKTQNKEKKFTQIQHGVSQRDSNIGLTDSQSLIKLCKRIYGACQLWRDAKENNLFAYLKAFLISAFVRLVSSEDKAVSSSSSLFDFSGPPLCCSFPF